VWHTLSLPFYTTIAKTYQFNTSHNNLAIFLRYILFFRGGDCGKVIYNIIALADIHWGATKPEILYDNLSIIYPLLDNINVDMIVICGDYFDAKVSLNSNIALMSIYWLNQLVENARQYGVRRIRIVKGTAEHDNDQLEVFRHLEDEEGYFKIINTNTVEETLPGLHCIYCPDENINTKEYEEIYHDNIYSKNDIGFFHGNFDVILPDIAIQIANETEAKNIIYRYDFWKNHVNGPLISGHWHKSFIHDHLYYIGSFDRWAFNEEESKGFGFIQYFTDTHCYFYKKIVNVRAKKYVSYTVDTAIYSNIGHYLELIRVIQSTLEKEEPNSIKVRVVINLLDDNPSTMDCITEFKRYLINNKNVKITIKNKMKTTAKKKEKEILKDLTTKYGFILDKSKTISEKIQQFILENNKKDISIDVIEDIVSKYVT
jgi:DNA repair exonuclease SbcCD nuclease subunit